MSNDPAGPPRGNTVRWVITGCLLALAVPCVGWVAVLKASAKVNAPLGSAPEKAFDATFTLLPAITALDTLALIGLAVWVLRKPVPGAVSFAGRWLGKVLLFLGLGAAVIFFFFATCWAVPAL
jgi:hypothetical protein